MLKDQMIITLLFQRDESGISEMEYEYGKALYKLSYDILKNHQDVQEMKNDTYLAAWNQIPPDRPGNLYAYLAAICRNLSFNRLDWQTAKKRKAEIVELTEEIEHLIPAPLRDKTMERAELGSLITIFLKEQKKEDRILFMRRYWHMNSIREIAEGCGISETKVQTRLWRMRNRLKLFLEKEGYKL